MLSFQNYITEQYLEEKLILYNQGKKYGQIVFLAGGAGSGKGFLTNDFFFLGFDAKNTPNNRKTNDIIWENVIVS